MNSELILILDFGGNQAYYTARRLRGERVYCEILPGDTPVEAVRAREPLGVILAGGDTNALRAEPLPFEPDAFGVPLMAFGGASRMLAERIGAAHQGIRLQQDKDFVQFLPCPLFESLSENDRFFERVDGFELPEDYKPVATTPSGLAPAFGLPGKGHIRAAILCGIQRSGRIEDPGEFCRGHLRRGAQLERGEFRAEADRARARGAR